jgi:DNA-binding response OmpR family regulator
MTGRLLLVEDEHHLATGLKLNFEFEGFAVDIAGTAREAMAALAVRQPYDLLLLDVTLPDLDGFELCERIRRSGNFTPIVMLTARASAEDRITGLESGADDYLTKPFELEELVARVRSQLRRRRWDAVGEGVAAHAAGDTLRFGRAIIHFDRHEVIVGGEPVKLTRLELDLVRFLAENAGRVVSRDELLQEVWKLRNWPNTRTVDNFLLRLRRHFEVDPANPVHFLSVRGSGYKFVRGPSTEAGPDGTA